VREHRDERRTRLLEALERAGGNRSRAGEILGVGRATLYRWLQRYDIAEQALRRIGDRYDVLEVLGEGAQSTVYLVRDRTGRLGEKALKLVRIDQLGETVLERARGEFRALAMLRHPGLVRVHDFGVDRHTGRPFLVLDRVEGVPFADAARGRPPEWIAAALELALEAVDHLHRQGLVHRDLKSDNVLVAPGSEDDPPRVTVMDLGLAEQLAATGRSATGTLPYLAPEVLLEGRASSRSDLWSLGATAYLALTSRFPYPDGALDERLSSGTKQLPPAPSTLRADVPPALDRIVLRLLEPEPARRYGDAAAARSDLAAWLDRVRRPDEGPGTTELVGRSEDFEAVLGWAEHSPTHPAAAPLLLLLGEGGIGKSRLLEAAVDELRARGHTAFTAPCREAGGTPFAPIGGILHDMLAGGGETAACARRLLERYPYARAILPRDDQLDAPRVESAAPSRFHVLDSVASLLADLAAEHPFVLVLDDVHQADPVLLDLLWHLARRSRGGPLRLLAAARPALVAGAAGEAVLQGLRAEELVQELSLGPLHAHAVRQIAERWLGAARASFLADRLWELTRGHPLFLQELLRSVAETPLEEFEDETLRLPHTVGEALQGRLGRVDAAGRQLLAAIAVAARPVEREELAALVGGDAGPIVAELIDLRILQPAAGGVELSHMLLAETLLDELAADEIEAWHRRWAVLLAGAEGREVERAGHLVEAGEGAAARDELLEAAERLFGSWQYQPAVRLFEAALRRFPAHDEERLAVYPRLARACREAHDPERAREVCSDWAELARQLERPGDEARALCALAANLRERYRWDEALAAAERAATLAEAVGQGESISLAYKTLASVHWLTWHHREAMETLDRAAQLCRESGDQRALANSLHDTCLPAALAGRSAAAEAALAESKRLYNEIGDHVWALMVHSNEALIRSYFGETEKAVELLRELVHEIEGMNVSVPVELALENLVFLLNRLGRYTEALEAARQLLDVASRFSRHNQRISALLGIGEALFQLDEREAARDHHRLAVELAAALGEAGQELYARLAVARDHRTDGRHDAALREARAVHETAGAGTRRRQALLAGLELARLQLEEGQLDAADRWLDEVERRLEVPSEDGPAHRVQLLLERARIAEAHGRLERASALIDEGIGLARGHGPVEAEIDLLVLMARVLDRQGQERERARVLRRAVRRIRAVAAGLDDPARRARYLARPDRAAVLSAGQRAAESEPSEPAVPDAATDALASLYEVSHSLAAGGDLDPLLRRIVELAVQRTGADRGLLMLETPGTGVLGPAAATGFAPDEQQEAARISRSALERADRDGALLVADTRSDPDLARAASVAMLGIRSVMCVPLGIGGETLGTLYVDSRGSQGFYTQADLRFLKALADQAAVALAYGRLVGRLSLERDAHRRAAEDTYRFGRLISRAPAMRRVFELLEKLAGADVPVIVLGESGTGKELVARALHYNSPRRERMFVSENCAAIPETLLESILFGHVQGAFTGADRDRPGLFALADGGTLLLDEFAEMSPGLQAKLLRVLQEHEFRPVGGQQLVRSNVRVVAASHRDPGELLRQGQLREDLYFRLSGVTVQIPPLRERREDIPLLVEHFLQRESAEARRPVPSLAPGVLRALLAHDWPGNVRELENVVRRALLLTEGDRIEVDVLGDDERFAETLRTSRGRRAPASVPEVTSADDEGSEVRAALEATGGNKEEAAALLGISRATLYRRLKRLH
jgi:transcriptional regulator with GAF, ATPase, and Fis domain/tRNA A-37 threonylcarbamoyl transferase component Bud32